MNDSEWNIYKKYFHHAYERYTLTALYDVICLTCGQRFGEHCSDRCPPYYMNLAHTKFKAPIPRTIKGNLPPK